jgi:hypothetical protein
MAVPHSCVIFNFKLPKIQLLIEEKKSLYRKLKHKWIITKGYINILLLREGRGDKNKPDINVFCGYKIFLVTA